MKTGKRALSLGLAGILLCTCCACGLNKKTPDEQFAAFLQESFVERVSQDGLDLHYTLVEPEAYGIRKFPGIFGALESDPQQTLKKLAELEAFDPAQLSPAHQVDYLVYNKSLTLQKQMDSFQYYDEPCDAFYGVQSQYPILLAEYTFRSDRDVGEYLTLLKDFGRLIDQVIAYEEKKSDRGMFMSPAAARKVIGICDDFLNSGEDNILLISFMERLYGLDGLKEKQLVRMETENRETVQKVVIPAFERLRAMLDAHKDSGSDSGLCQYERGKAFYEALVASKTGSSRSVEDLMKLVDRKLAAAILTIGMQEQQVLDEIENLPGDSRDPLDLLGALRTVCREDYPELRRPPDVHIKNVPDSLKSASSPAFYIVPPYDRGSANLIYINDGAQSAGGPLYFTMAHEGYPGHMYQTNFYRGTNPSILRLSLDFSGYVEGWAQYVELEAYRDYPVSEGAAAALQADAWFSLLIGAHLDFAIHYQGKNRADVAAFLRNWGYDEAAAGELYDMLQATPGYYLPYAIGALEFSELRARAEDALGEAFSPMQFHEAVLTCGPAPFDVVSQAVDRYLGNH